MPRPSFLEVMHRIAFTWSERATCERMQAGTVAFNSRYQVLAAGYNGALKGEPHCTDDGEGCLIDEVTGRCIRTVHAEQNMIAQAARLGVALDGMMAYSTARPCEACTKLLIQSGISELYYYYSYPSDSEERVNKMAERAGVKLFGPLVDRGELDALGRAHSALRTSGS